MNGTRGIWVIALSLLTVVVIASNPTGLIAIIGLLMAVVFFSLFSHYFGLFTKLSVWCLSAIISVCCFAASLFLVWGSFRITSSPNSWPLGFPFPDEVVLVIHGLVNEPRVSPFANMHTLLAIGFCVASLMSLCGLAVGGVVSNERMSLVMSRPVDRWQTYVFTAFGAGVGVWISFCGLLVLFGKSPPIPPVLIVLLSAFAGGMAGWSLASQDSDPPRREV